MHTRLFKPALASLLVALLPACGDDKGDTTSATDATFTSAPDATTTTGQVPTTTGDDTTGVVDPPGTTSSSTTDVDPSTTTSDDTTGGIPGDCQAPADELDEDMDGVDNSADNCRCDANPNQLDFDGNAVGNVCDLPIALTMISGTPPAFNKLDTTARAEQTGASCEFPVSLIVVGARAEITLDDAGTGKLYFPSFSFADTPEQQCDIKLGPIPVVSLKLYIKDFTAVGVDPFVVGFPFTIPDHAAGNLNGATDSPHALNISATIVITESSDETLAPKGENPLDMLPGQFSSGGLAVSKEGGQLALTFSDPDFVVFDQMTMGGIRVTMTGLSGTLQLEQ